MGPCPNCRGMGWIPDGFYEFTDDTLNIFSTWPVERLRDLTKAIEAARQAPNPRAAVEQALKNDPDLAELARRLSAMRDAAAFWGFIAVILATIALLTSKSESHAVVSEQTVIEKVVSQSTPTVPQPVGRKPPPLPPPPKRRKPKGGKQRR